MDDLARRNNIVRKRNCMLLYLATATITIVLLKTPYILTQGVPHELHQAAHATIKMFRKRFCYGSEVLNMHTL